ncbi:hypothetical protein [Desulfosoma caldarium]|nr:hypothetical protein [Desulfosoma caldarium]
MESRPVQGSLLRVYFPASADDGSVEGMDRTHEALHRGSDRLVVVNE